ncbi:MAG: chorismate mutase [Anaerolineae bacterium]
MAIRGVRGAITVEEDELGAILSATRELLEQVMKENAAIRIEDIASAFFTLTEDLSTAYPALAARQMGWESIPMICSREIPVPEGLPRVVRVLVHWNTDVPQSEIRHVYLRDAVALRPDLSPTDQSTLSGVEER